MMRLSFAQLSQLTEVVFVEALCEIFTSYFPEFWHLGQDYFSSRLAVKPNMGRQEEMKVQ